MQCLKVGLILMTLLPALAIGQVSGSVESIGFDSYVRADAWASMVITVTPGSPKTEEYEVRVRLQDLDRDQPIAVRKITVTGNAEGSERTQRFRMYFMPPPTDKGLRDAVDPGALRDLQEQVKVSIHQGGKWICDLPITGTVHVIDPAEQSQTFSQLRGEKLLIAVTDGRSRATYLDAGVSLLGVMEEVALINVSPRDLPDSVLGYDSVDGIIWLDADPAQLKTGGDEKFRALDTYIRRGGKLVICQAFDWQKILQFEDLLPVTVLGVETKDDLAEYRKLLAPLVPPSPQDYPVLPSSDVFELKPPFRFARAKAKPNTTVISEITWKPKTDTEPGDTSPYMVRMPWDLGMITWVAQDLGDTSLPRPRGLSNWAHAWDKVFDWKNSPVVATTDMPDRIRDLWGVGPNLDVGKSLIETWMDLQAKGAWLISLAVMFFIAYWLIAGPGSYTYLATKRKTHLSWFIFGVCALAATGLTAIIKKFVLEGPPEIKHFSVVRMAPNSPAFVTSRIGLYIPRDGKQTIELKDFSPQTVNTITPLMIHPQFLINVPDQKGPEYDIPIPDPTGSTPPVIEVPYRSTLKKLQATWTGPLANSVQGSGKLVARGSTFIEGKLTNGTGQALRNVYIAFRYPRTSVAAYDGDWVYFRRSWDPGVTLDLERDFARSEDGTRDLPMTFAIADVGGALRLKGRLDRDWMPYWTDNLTGGANYEATYDDSSRPMRKSLPMMSFFDRMPPMRNLGRAPQRTTRLELLRRGGRWLDMSAAVAAGQLVVIAEANGPLPIPMEVEGDRVTGDGLILYQFALPLDHSVDLNKEE